MRGHREYRLVQLRSPMAKGLAAHTLGSDFDTVIAVYRQTFSGLELLGCNDDYHGLLSDIRIFADPGVEYYFQVGGYYGARGNLSFSFFEDSCGDNFCGSAEDCSSCPHDCGVCCGNGTCDVSSGENCQNCTADCGYCCGNATCDASLGETCNDCRMTAVNAAATAPAAIPATKRAQHAPAIAGVQRDLPAVPTGRRRHRVRVPDHRESRRVRSACSGDSSQPPMTAATIRSSAFKTIPVPTSAHSPSHRTARSSASIPTVSATHALSRRAAHLDQLDMRDRPSASLQTV